MIRRPPRSTQGVSSAASDVYKRQVADYLNNRPELIDVSIEPKLIINGTPHPTGTKQT